MPVLGVVFFFKVVRLQDLSNCDGIRPERVPRQPQTPNSKEEATFAQTNGLPRSSREVEHESAWKLLATTSVRIDERPVMVASMERSIRMRELKGSAGSSPGGN